MDKPSWRAEIIDENAAWQKIIERFARLFDVRIGMVSAFMKRNVRTHPDLWAHNVRPGLSANVVRPGPRTDSIRPGIELG